MIPEPVAPFFDLFYIGEGETMYRQLFDLYKTCRKTGKSRKEFLMEAGKLPGIYAPEFYETTYHDDGTIAAFYPVTYSFKNSKERSLTGRYNCPAWQKRQPLIHPLWISRLGITLQYEMCYTNILQVLDLSGIPFFDLQIYLTYRR